jgi:DNA modification methylase
MQTNQIHNDDCINFMRNMEDKCIDMTLTDIPYAECNKESGGLREIDKGDADKLNFDLDIFINEVIRVTKNSIYIFCGIQQVSPIYKKFRETGLVTRHCIWEKRDPSPMNGQFTWLSAIENCIFAKFPGSIFNEFCQSNVWRENSGSSKLHPTQKPIMLFKRLIEASSVKGEIIFDPCIGSGTTAIAALSCKRKFIGVEKNLEWCKTAQRRVKQSLRQDIFASMS